MTLDIELMEERLFHYCSGEFSSMFIVLEPKQCPILSFSCQEKFMSLRAFIAYSLECFFQITKFIIKQPKSIFLVPIRGSPLHGLCLLDSWCLFLVMEQFGGCYL
jgi:hypothetical protein